jgi:5-amino-6-(5-phospho-D-ribitylamino)uracil phosphatase
MKTLYISDLDGTLLNQNAEVSEYTTKTLNKLIEKGLYFSIATARTTDTVTMIIKDIENNVPVILMNGVLIYDMQNSNYLKIESITPKSVTDILNLLKEHQITGFLYSIENDKITTYYEDLIAAHRKAFYDERAKKFGRVFTKVNSFNDVPNKNIIYVSVCDKKELLEPLYNSLKASNELHIEFYMDIYLEDYWYMEIFSANASKYKAVRFLREKLGFDKIISFGDNLNDLPMFRASDESYAVSNAKDEVKNAATGVIDSNIENGVIRWLEGNI